MMDKPALVPWAAKMAAEYAVTHREAITLLDDTDAAQLIKSNWRKQRDKAADFGTVVHQMIETDYMPPADDPAYGYCQQAQQMLNDTGLIVVAAEVTVANPTSGYAGTVDVIATDAHGDTIYLDWKTGKGLYFDSHGMQLAALMEASHVAGPDGTLAPIPGEQIPTAGIAVRLAADSYEAKGVTAGTDNYVDLFQAFAGLTDVWILKNNRRKWDTQ